ncbi:MAG: DUF4388 domain-containing protein, partial [Chloroflexota bacterium]|nr:DUF4388 domain-containing protein [Chloroflexota bacterium]
MTELSGTLEGIGLLPLLTFLSGLRATGRLAIADRELSGALYFVDGRVVGADFGQDTGQVALDAIGLALGGGRFNFTDDGGERARNLDLDPAELQLHLEQLAAERQRLMAGLPSLDAAPQPLADGPDDQPIALDRGTLRLLMRCDGRTSVMDLARDAGLLVTLKRLARLFELNLIRADQAAPPPAAQVASGLPDGPQAAVAAEEQSVSFARPPEPVAEVAAPRP